MDDTRPLDERKERILRRIVENYIDDGEPVGSKAIADSNEIGCSAATVRNEMGVLEREGYILQPHTSAGRVPTDKAYRYYVDSLADTQPDSKRVREAELRLAGTLSALDELLKSASHLLSEITSYTSIASAPAPTEAVLRHVQLVDMGSGRVFVLVVGEAAWHVERLIGLDADTKPSDVADAQLVMNQLAPGAGIGSCAQGLINARTTRRLRPILDAVAALLVEISQASGRVYAQGTGNLVVWEPAPTAQRVLELIDSGGVDSMLAVPATDGVSVRIGRELDLDAEHELSLIAAGYRLGRRAGSVGIIGPTRMNYPSVMARVGEVAESLSRVLKRLES